MSVKELKIAYNIRIRDLEDNDERFDLCIDGQHTYLDRSQAHLLMLWLQEHLK